MPSNKRKRSSRSSSGGYGRRKYRKKRSGYSARGRQASSSKRAAVRRLANSRYEGLLGIELKTLDTSNGGFSSVVSSATVTGCEIDPATIDCLTAPAQGDTYANRDGKRIVGKKLYIRGVLRKAAMALSGTLTDVDKSGICTIWIILDTQTNGTQLSSENVLSNVSATASCGPEAFLNPAGTQRYRTLARMCFDARGFGSVTDDGTYVLGGAQEQTFEINLDLKDLVINFNTAVEGICDNVIDNSIHFIACASGANLWDLCYNSRFRFVG